MVKVKALINFANSSVTNGFNHPMVKVKDTEEKAFEDYARRFNHPMVKVKAVTTTVCATDSSVSTTLW